MSLVEAHIQNLREAQLAKLSAAYLGAPTFGHFSPGHRLADWAFLRLFSFHFAAAAWIMVIGFAVTLVLFHRVLAEMFRPGAGPLVLTLVYGVSLVHVGTTQWWAAGIDRVCATGLDPERARATHWHRRAGPAGEGGVPGDLRRRLPEGPPRPRVGRGRRTDRVRVDAEGGRLPRDGVRLILTPAAAARPIPFFVRRPQKQLWYLLASSTDEPFELALRNFLRESLFYGQYGAIYERSFGVLPDYGRIRELIDP